MKYVFCSVLFLILFLILPGNIHAQLEKVIVERYYVSDANDSTDVTGGKLDSGSVTYRIYVDMKPGSKLKKIYGDVNHRFKIASTELFFNNIDRGVGFGKDMNTSYLDDNTSALDTWLTLGQVAKNNTSTYFGVLKSGDTNGSIIGGANNDGGSANIAGGLLVNTNATAGLPLTTSDGMMPVSSVPSNWFDTGFDSSMISTEKIDTQFISYSAILQNSGASGVNADSNQVIIAQLTTKGELSFEFNLSIVGADGKTINYVANDSVLLTDEKLSRYLKYPFQLLCGCLDPDYLEYDVERDCHNQDSCKNLIVFGCMDPQACNYDPDANWNVPFLCCYPGYCNDRDITVVCPETSNTLSFDIYPNPTQTDLTIEVSNGTGENVSYMIFDSFGNTVLEKDMGSSSDYPVDKIDVSTFNNGLYLIRVVRGGSYETKMFMKN